MSQEQLKAADVTPLQDAAKSMEKPAEGLEENLKTLEKFGGFDLLESAIDNIQNLNPERNARKKIFLDESAKKAERESLKKTLQWWADILSSSDDLGEMIKSCQDKSDQSDQLLKRL